MLYDIMTERNEITTMLQRELSTIPAVYGEQLKGVSRRTGYRERECAPSV